MGNAPAPTARYPAPPVIEPRACPIATSLTFLGRKWTLPVLRDIAFFPAANFALIRRRNAGLSARTLSIRLRELQREDLVRKVVRDDDPRHPTYELTERGTEIWPILAALFQFGIREHAATVFADGRPRELAEVYPQDAELLLGRLLPYARATSPSSAPEGPTALRGSRGTRGSP